eukprot:m.18912 g.18912  ORF g.18912 m.18912 type:complete len:243 (-) comp12257_c0_seq1:35-763(-)
MQLTYLTDDDSQWQRHAEYEMRQLQLPSPPRSSTSLATGFFRTWKEPDVGDIDSLDAGSRRWLLSARIVHCLAKCGVTEESQIPWAEITRRVATVDAAPTIVILKIQWEWLKSLLIDEGIPFTDMLACLSEVLAPWMASLTQQECQEQDQDQQHRLQAQQLEDEDDRRQRQRQHEQHQAAHAMDFDVDNSTPTEVKEPAYPTTPPPMLRQRRASMSEQQTPSSFRHDRVKRRSYIPIRVLCV